MTPRYTAISLLHVLFLFLFASCGGKNGKQHSADNTATDSLDVPISYTVALADVNGDGMRITYQFYDLDKADTGDYRMIHVYMKVDGTEDTMTVSGSWKLLATDSGEFIRVNYGKSSRLLEKEGRWNLLMGNKDSLMADTGRIILRQKADNDLRNSTIHLYGKVRVNADKTAIFIDETGDSIPVLKLSAFRKLLEKNDSVNLETGVNGIQLMGTIQIRMAMDGKSTQKSLIVEQVGKTE
jgi:hypothetical protein